MKKLDLMFIHNLLQAALHHAVISVNWQGLRDSEQESMGKQFAYFVGSTEFPTFLSSELDPDECDAFGRFLVDMFCAGHLERLQQATLGDLEPAHPYDPSSFFIASYEEEDTLEILEALGL